MKELTLDLGVTIPLAQFEMLKPNASVTVEKLQYETDEELFVRAHKQLWDTLEAEIAISMAKIMKIRNETGMAAYARELGEDIGAGNNRFINEYLQTLKPNKEKQK